MLKEIPIGGRGKLPLLEKLSGARKKCFRQAITILELRIKRKQTKEVQNFPCRVFTFVL